MDVISELWGSMAITGKVVVSVLAVMSIYSYAVMVDRFLALRGSVFQNPDSFFKFYAELSDQEAVDVARSIWREINGRNLAENIAGVRVVQAFTQEMIDQGVCIVAGEVEHKWPDILKDAIHGELKELYNFLEAF